uniref:Uncharacterized protein n=1 Tax=Romanomermis culicivorax TaxID=13658 RepID=A0A915JLT0_ROMCU
MLPALAFVPLNRVEESFDYLCNNNDYPDIVQPIIDQFQTTWIGDPGRQHCQAPRFAHGIWKCYDAVQTGLPKTNNSCEGWHREFSEMIGASHPTIW